MKQETNFYKNCDGKALRVLVVEDDEVNLLVIVRLLEKKGCEVKTAVNGQKALCLLGNDMFDIVLMDISMPKIDGIALTRKMKRNSHTQNVPIVAMTTYASDRDQENLRSEGLDGYLLKPVDPDELFKIILKLTSPDYGVIDHKGLLMRTDGDIGFIKDIAEVFCHTSASAVTEIKNSTDLQVIAGLAHKLKGSAETVGSRTVAEIAKLIKEATEKGDFKGIHEACANFDETLDLFKNSLTVLGINMNDTGE